MMLLFAGTLLLAIWLYFFFAASTKTFVRVNISAKALKNANTLLVYSSTSLTDTSQLKKEGNIIMAWQFYKNYAYDVYDPESISEMVLFLGEASNTIFFDKISMVQVSGNQMDTLYQWNPGDDMPTVFTASKNAKVVNVTARMMQMNLEGGVASVHMDFAKGMKYFHREREWLRLSKPLLAALLIALFVFFTIQKAPALNLRMKVRIQPSKTILLPGMFLCFLILVFFDSILKWIPDMKNRENRSLTQMPILNARSFFTFPDEFSTYAGEHYTARNVSFFIHSVLNARLFHESVLPDKVIMGKRTWMYYYEEGSLKDVRRLTKIDSAEINNVIGILLNRIAWLEHRHIKYYILVPPNKERIYPEFLPDGYYSVSGFGHNRLDYYKKFIAAHTSAVFVDPTDSLYVAKLRKDVYYHSDTHWNLYGGFIGYRCLMQELVRDFPQLKPMQENDFEIGEAFNAEGDLSSMLSLQRMYKRKEFFFSAKDSSKKLLPDLPTQMYLHFSHNATLDSSELKLLMFRDSYANYLIPFLNLHFREATYIWNYEFMPDLVEKFKPDVVIFESLERFMSYALTIPNSPQMDAEVAKMRTVEAVKK